MRKLGLVVLVFFYCLSFVHNACASTLQKGETAYARSNLRLDANVIWWHNMSAFQVKVPVGTEVKITDCAGSTIAFVSKNTNKTLYVVAPSKLWDKYFVKDQKEIGLEKLSPDRKDQVEKCAVLNGMTKEEVYASKGCPAYNAWGNKTENISLNEIMQSDKWYYNSDTRRQDVMVTFLNGVVVKVGGFEK